jgi:hypothetical protein
LPAKVKQEIESSSDGLTLNEEMFTQLLEAACVVQQQHDAAAVANESDPARTLSEVVETQELIRSGQFDLGAACGQVAHRLQYMAAARGVAIAVAREGHLHFLASTGSGVTRTGSRLPIDSSFAALFPRPNGARSPSTPLESLSQSGDDSLSSLLVFPVHYEGRIAGIVELRFNTDPPYPEHLIRTGQLMCSLVAEAIAREADLEWKRTLAIERSTMIEALEKIKPHLDRLASETLAVSASPEETEPQGSRLIESSPETASAGPLYNEANTDSVTPTAEPQAKEEQCRMCGYKFSDREMFCGNCGTARSYEDAGDLQGKWASMWRMHQAAETKEKENLDSDAKDPTASDSVPTVDDSNNGAPQVTALPTALLAQNNPTTTTPWTSATHTRKWLESVETDAPGKRWLLHNRANLYLGAALVMLILVLSGWGTRHVQEQISAVRQKSSPTQLTSFERMLVSIGLAEAPTAPVYKGNPNTQVWVDLHTALYYCPGSDLYGKTLGGKFTTQSDAQQDQFQPAAEKSCD